MDELQIGGFYSRSSVLSYKIFAQSIAFQFLYGIHTVLKDRTRRRGRSEVKQWLPFRLTERVAALCGEEKRGILRTALRQLASTKAGSGGSGYVVEWASYGVAIH